MKGCCYAKHWHDDRLVLLVDIELHVPNVLLTRHLGNILVGHIRLSGPRNEVQVFITAIKSVKTFIRCKV